MKLRMQIVGQKFWKMTVVGFSHLDKRRNSYWLCVCECRTEKTCSGYNLKKGSIKSCGCTQHEKRVEKRAEDHQDFRVFSGMLSRCFNEKSASFPSYGGRGIVVCDRWRDGGFWIFNSDMGDRPTLDHSIDRIDNNGPYSPDNCRWATCKEQSRNTRSNKLFTHDGQTLTMVEWAEKLGINYRTLKSRIRKGQSLESSLSG